MKKFFSAIARAWSCKWVKFGFWTLVYVLIFVVWTGNLWPLLGVPVIYDVYISKLMYRYIWSQHKELKSRNKAYKFTMDWVEAIVFAVVVASVIRIFFFGMYVIPTGSMEKSLLIGDYLCVSKVAYGPQMPNTPVAFPMVHHTMPFSTVKKSFSECIQWPYHRLKGFGDVKRGDVVVFNFPAGDTVAIEVQESATYYDLLEEFRRHFGERQAREELAKNYTVIYRPVDKRENYVKRAVGLPGDSIHIVDTELLVNGKPLGEIPRMQYYYHVTTNGTPINAAVLEEMGLSRADVSFSNGMYWMPLTAKNLERVKSMRNILDITPYVARGANPMIFPRDTVYAWNEDNFGPLWVPCKGATTQLTLQNLPLYRRVIEAYEGHKLEIRDNTIYIDEEPATSYTFAMDYYFMMGDNRHNSADSRFWGFVPEDHIVGKASFVWLSLDPEKGLFSSKIRWGRMMRGIKGIEEGQ